jgi:cytochrome P450
MSIIIVSLFVIVFLLWIYKRTQKPKDFPPGPPRWPLIGSLPYITGQNGSLLLGLVKPVQKFGPVIGYYVGNTPAVLVADYNILKEICKLDSLSHRPSISPMHYFTQGWETMLQHGEENIGRPAGIVFSNGTYWKEQRRFVARNLKEFGFGKSTLEALVEEEVLKLCKFLKTESKDGVISVSMMQPLKLVIISILWAILFGEQLGINNPKLAELIHLIDEGLRIISPQTFLGMILPDPRMTLWPVLRNLTGMNMVEKIRGPTNKFLSEVIKDHQQTMDESNLRGFVDRQLLEIQKTTNSKSSFFGSSGYSAMFNNVSDIFLAGQDTTSSSILWTFLYLLHHPEFQNKIHNELDEVI